jgi:dihydrodipicolinate synthase/N-acetylneuraminate lyase
MELIGKKAGPPRPPLLPAMKEERKRLEKLLREAKIIE